MGVSVALTDAAITTRRLTREVVRAGLRPLDDQETRVLRPGLRSRP